MAGGGVGWGCVDGGYGIQCDSCNFSKRGNTAPSGSCVVNGARAPSGGGGEGLMFSSSSLRSSVGGIRVHGGDVLLQVAGGVGCN